MQEEALPAVDSEESSILLQVADETIHVECSLDDDNDITLLDTSTTISSATVNNRHSLIDQSGICTSCDDGEALDASLQCLFCKCKFHGVCRNAGSDRKGKSIICPRSFFNAYRTMIDSEIYKKRPGNFHFLCDYCQK